MKTKFFVVVAFLTIAISANAQTKKWNLIECVNYAIENNIQVKQTVLDTLLAVEDINSRKMNYFQGLNASASHRYNFGTYIGQFGTQISSDTRGNSFGLNTGVTIFNGFQNLNVKKQADLGLESSRLQLDILEDNISVMVANSYLNILFNKENLRIAKEQAEITQKQIDQIEELVNSGVRAKADLFSVQAQLASDNEAIVNAENSIELAKLGLAQLLMISPVGFDIADVSVEIPDANLKYQNSDEIFNVAVIDRPEIKRAELDIENSELSIDLAKGNYYPTLTFGAGLGTSYQHRQGKSDEIIIDDPLNPGNPIVIDNSFWTQLDNNMGYNMGFNLSIPVFNGFRTKSSVNRAIVNQRKAEYRLEQEKQDLRTNVETAFTDAKAALNQFIASEASLIAQNAAFDNAQQSFDLGAMTSFEFEQIRTRKINAESSLLRAKYNFVFKSKLLEFYYGIPIVAQGITFN
ncbi:TolC family protein [Urechidicola vernalis]|uniref:TolC family protein n=1 Tax=Urechidicola vernalis TaxID=3075600 RepID=A0ABU2Y783_9FLAO|nr:TolC family protein [Urechidicola sp. P050]MDT0554058.1 TolC family protein [Urechidicola sp. P050]